MDRRLNSENGIVRQSQLEAELSNAEFSGISNRYIPIGDSTKLARNAAMGSSSLPARVARCQMHLPIRGTPLTMLWGSAASKPRGGLSPWLHVFKRFRSSSVQ